MKRTALLLFCVVFALTLFSGCDQKGELVSSALPSQEQPAPSTSASSQDLSFKSQFEGERYQAFSWLVLEETSSYHLAIPQLVDESSAASEINLLIRTKFYDYAEAVMDGTVSLPDSLYEVAPSVAMNGDLLNLVILQTPSGEENGDGKVFCAAYDTRSQTYLRLADALEKDGQTELTIQSAVVKAYLAAYSDVLPEEIASITLEGVLNLEGQNEYICYLTEYPADGIEYRYVIGYSPTADTVYDLGRYVW